MKSVLRAIGATIGFIGLVGLVLFVFEAAGTGTLNLPTLPTGNLTANIVSNNPVDATPSTNNVGQDQTAIISTAVPAPAPISPAPQTPNEAPASTPTPAPAPTPAPTPTPPPPSLAPLADAGAAVTSTDATTSIMVTTSPPPASPLPPQPSTTPTPGPAALTLPFNETDFHGDTNWITTWGTTDVAWSGALDLMAGPGSTGGAVYLKNTEHWTSYQMSATVDWTAGKTFGLMADYRDASNYVLCVFERTDPTTVAMRLAEFRGGSETFLTPEQTVSWSGGPETDVTASMKVTGVYGTCSFAGTSVSNDEIGAGNTAMSSIQNGSIGFTVSDPSPNVSQVIIKSVAVTSA